MEHARPDLWRSRDPLPTNPAEFVKQRLDEAFALGIQPNPHAVALVTAAPDERA